MPRFGRGTGRSASYALAVSFEVAVEAGIQVYEQVRARLAVPVRAGAA